jgi:hypothetical protein
MIMAQTAIDIQAQIDPWFLKVGLRASPPTAGQSANHYLAEQCRFLKRQFLPQNHPLYKVNYRKIRDDSTILNGFVPQLLEAVVTEAFNPNNVEPGEFRKIERRDEYGQVKFVEFIGPESFVKQMGRPGRRVVSTCCPVDHSGRSCGSLTIGRPIR